MTNETELRAALAKFGGIKLGFYALLPIGILNTILSFVDLTPAGQFVPLVVFLINLPGLMLIFVHIFILLRSLGKATHLTKNVVLIGSLKYFLWGSTLLAVIPAMMISFACFFDWHIAAGIFFYDGELCLGIFTLYFIINRKACALLWIWISTYDADESGENVLNLIRTHPQGRWVDLAFKAVFAQGATRARATAKLVHLVTYKGEPEEDEDDIETKRLAQQIDPSKHILFETSPQKIPVRPRDIRDGNCPNCGAPVSSPTARYCTGCGETFGENW